MSDMLPANCGCLSCLSKILVALVILSMPERAQVVYEVFRTCFEQWARGSFLRFFHA